MALSMILIMIHKRFAHTYYLLEGSLQERDYEVAILVRQSHQHPFSTWL